MTKTKKFYLKLGLSEKDILNINKELALPAGVKLSPFAKPRRIEMLQEAERIYNYFPYFVCGPT